MVRILEQRIIEGNKKYIDCACLSNDTKPTADIVTGSTALEVDTSDAYFFDEVSGTWIKAAGGGGGDE